MLESIVAQEDIEVDEERRGPGGVMNSKSASIVAAGTRAGMPSMGGIVVVEAKASEWVYLFKLWAKKLSWL